MQFNGEDSPKLRNKVGVKRTMGAVIGSTLQLIESVIEEQDEDEEQ